MIVATARQLEIEGLESETDRGTPRQTRIQRNLSTDFARTAKIDLHIPEFNTERMLYAITSRQAGRINAASIPEKEQEDLLAERQMLLDKVFDGSITRKESNRLEYVRWSLDRIEDAKHGLAMDRLESVVSSYEKFVEDIGGLKEQLDTLSTQRK
jgi:hypothetical protein